MNLICTSKTSGYGTSSSCRSGCGISGSGSSGRGSAGLVSTVMAVVIGEGTGCVIDGMYVRLTGGAIDRC